MLNFEFSIIKTSPKSLDRFLTKPICRIISWRLPHTQNWISIQLRGWFGRIPSLSL